VFRDCLRCGLGWREGEAFYPVKPCPLCCTLDDEQAEFVRELHDRALRLRRLARHMLGDYEGKLSRQDLIDMGFPPPNRICHEAGVFDVVTDEPLPGGE
jgi:hypothetical protein